MRVHALILAAGLLGALGCAAAPPVLEFDGEAVQGGLLFGRVSPGARVLVEGRPVRVSPAGEFLVGFNRDAPAAATVVALGADGERTEAVLAVGQRTYRIQRIDGLPPRQVTPDPEQLARIRREAAEIRAARERDDPRVDFLGGFQWPAIGPISGVYGSQRVLNGEPRQPHYGVDVAAPAGTTVRAPAGGIVTFAHPDMYFSGATVVLDHGHGLSSSFLHLSRILVSVGDRVERGEPIGEIGASGRVTGAHLDWRMNLGEARIDPELLVGPMPPR